MERKIVFVCVGDSSVLFDSFGALVGDKLRESGLGFHVFGGTQNPITTKNIEAYITTIKKEFDGYKIVIIDSTVLNLETDSLNFLEQKICLKEGRVLIDNINYECGDYNILCKTFYFKNNRIFSINIADLLTLASKVSQKILEKFKI